MEGFTNVVSAATGSDSVTTAGAGLGSGTVGLGAEKVLAASETVGTVMETALAGTGEPAGFTLPASTFFGKPPSHLRPQN